MKEEWAQRVVFAVCCKHTSRPKERRGEGEILTREATLTLSMGGKKSEAERFEGEKF